MTAQVIEFCSGYGGASAGMIAAGLEIEASYDTWPVAVDAHRRWHPSVPCEVRDVATVTPEELEGRIVWASLPCQAWSQANRVRRGKSHSSYYSLAHFARQVQHSEIAILENVPGLLIEQDGRAELAELERECNRLNLSLSINLIPAAWFGVPQLRRRAIILIGGPLVLFRAAQITGQLSSAPQATWGGGVDSARYKAGLRPSLMASEGKGRHGGNGSMVKRRELERAVVTKNCGGNSLAPAVTNSGNRPNSRDNGETDARRSPAQNAELQGVPIEHIAHLPKSHQYTLIGNSMPPKFAQGVIQQVLEFSRGHNAEF
jgi:site-specific DNA-cytosine methylase